MKGLTEREINFIIECMDSHIGYVANELNRGVKGMAELEDSIIQKLNLQEDL